jgi:hypothetical protein
MTAFGDEEVRAHYIERMANVPGITPEQLNDVAWSIATAPDPTEAELQVALGLAERAAEETEYAEPTILDTLAEVQFSLGQTLNAIATIEEAIAHDPEEAYYREQWKRFSGERDSDDRPQYVPPMFRDPGNQRRREPPQSDPGLTV